MGVDINFYIEVRKGKKWRPLIWQTPVELKSFISKEDEGKKWEQNNCFFWCRYYHFRDFIVDRAHYGLPDDVSMEMKEHISDFEMGKGYFLLSDLQNFYHIEEDKMLSQMLQSRDYKMVEKLKQIEKQIKGKPVAKKDKENIYPYEERSIKEIYEDFQEEYGIFLQLLMAVRCFLEGANIYTDDYEVRILYGIC